MCLFCGETGDLHEVMTLEVDEKVRKMATDLQDSALLKYLAGGDMIAIEAKYHKKCMTNLTNRHRAFLRQSQDCQSGEEDEKNEGIAFVELISFMESFIDDGKYVLTLTELHQLNRLQDFAIKKEVIRTRLKSRIRTHFPGKLQEQSDGKTVLLVFNEGMASILREELWKHDYETDTLTLAKAATIVRRVMLNQPGFRFLGSFPSNCQTSSVPSSFKGVNINAFEWVKYSISKRIRVTSNTNNITTNCFQLQEEILYNFKQPTLAGKGASIATVRWPEYTRIHQKQEDHKRTLSTRDKCLLRQIR